MEVVGVAGVGKTTLVRALKNRDATLTAGIRLPKTTHLHFLLAHLFRLLPLVFRRGEDGKWFSWAQIRSMVYLDGWHRVIERTPPKRHLLLDHGPAFRLAMLKEFGPAITRSPVFLSWWEQTLRRWAGTLDLVVWLDAPESVLLDRIHARDHRHRVKGLSEEGGYEFLRRYQRAYEQVIRELTGAENASLVRFDSSSMRPEEISDELLAVLREKSGARD